MKQILLLLRIYGVMVLLFLVAKPCFIMAQPLEVRGDWAFSDLMDIWLHGLPLDLATAGYVAAPLWLLLGVSLWVRVPHLKAVYKVYMALVSALLALIWVSDACLYTFWGIKLDGTVWNYLDQPGGALSSVSAGYALTVVLSILLLGVGTWTIVGRLLPAEVQPVKRRRLLLSVAWILLGGLLFLGIRGGIGKSTANVGMVYYSDRQFFNHAAVNPVFSIASSLKRTKDFAAEYDFFEEAERARIYSSLHYSTKSEAVDSLLRTNRPNVLLILMEGCGAQFVHAVNPEADPRITPNLNRLAKEGITFSRCYANSFRTDRGTVSTLSGFPAFPDFSVMKQPSMAGKLPGIARSLRRVGYQTEFLYGGDINFTNTNGYLLATGYERTYGETSFPASVRRTHDWGVTDAIAFDSLSARISRYPTNRPWHLGFLTLASHEPWEVPYDRIKGDRIANTMAYLDDCVGRFIDHFRRTPQWANTLIILLPDHGIVYPEGITDVDERKSHIPLIWTGGAIKGPRLIETLCNQSDLAATLLGQLGLPHDDFRFSRDVMSRTYTRPSAIHTWSEGIYYLDESGISVVNLLTKPASLFRESPRSSRSRQNAAKAFLQTSYDHLGQLSR